MCLEGSVGMCIRHHERSKLPKALLLSVNHVIVRVDVRKSLNCNGAPFTSTDNSTSQLTLTTVKRGASKLHVHKSAKKFNKNN